MNLEIVTIGDELLIGQVVDTNSAWMGRKLNEAGFEVSRINSIRDTEEEILNILSEASDRADVVLLTGGLGPTKDDITKETLCKYFNTELVFNQEVFENVKSLIKRYVSNINKLNRSQAMVPANCTVISNPVGTAPIMWFEHEGTVFVSMPGVPSEMKYAMEFNIIPKLVEKFNIGSIVHKTVLVQGIPEAVLAEMLEDFEGGIASHISLAYLPAPGQIRLRFTGRGESKADLEAEITTLVEQLKPIIGNNILALEDVSITKIIAELFLNKELTLSSAESCTGGNIAHMITSLPGSSAYFKGSVVAYHNQVKQHILGVSDDDLANYGAVSQPVVEQMARGARKALDSDYAVATSGIAGPDGGTEEKPVGTVWISVSGPDRTISEKFQFGTIRERNIIRASEMALVMLKKMIENK
ncbi:competence/damage-inducible protein A [Plebeiibacterium marinum]|uniref:CinA-like protein n=1 Tax=Plebeiibacterium marinum TaxID=2992111 RepID=A0AAE3SJS0_9BACT|nr:competence/damage-inducible protein A [Plebeiobacterium marinum]MCW3804670.1 competence/damage-inducible protein A [Plebeiobacterium marinum]